jgi:hypothetical protein
MDSVRAAVRTALEQVIRGVPGFVGQNGGRSAGGASREEDAAARSRHAMTSHTTQSFREAFARFPKGIQSRARAAYQRFRIDPYHTGLQFKKVHRTRPVYSARVTNDYRVMGIMDGDEIVWYRIGRHEEYERLLKQL